MDKKKPKRPADINQLAASILRDTITEKTIPTAHNVSATNKESIPTKEKNPAAVALGRLGGLKGGNARASKLSPEKRKEIAEKAAKARWSNAPTKLPR